LFSRVCCVLAAVIGLGLAGWSLADDKDGKDAKGKAKPNVIEIDLSKLPPDVAKQVLESLKKETAKPISLIEAITIAEKVGKGQATKAERKGEGAETQFKVDVVGIDGTKVKLTLSAAGKVVESGEEPRKGPPAGKAGKVVESSEEPRKGPPSGKGPTPGKGFQSGARIFDPANREPEKSPPPRTVAP
jgi:uncharacterized membrane protein YkoI